MRKHPTRFRQHDITRALRAARNAGIEIGRIEIEPMTGKILIVTRVDAGGEETSPLDKWIKKHGEHPA